MPLVYQPGNGLLKGDNKNPFTPLDDDYPHAKIRTSIPQAQVTVQRKPYVPPKNPLLGPQIESPGTARANIAATPSHPNGTTTHNHASTHSHQTVLQQHCSFFDPDNDGIIWPLDTYRGFRRLHFNPLISLLAVLIIHANFSYPTVTGTILPDPFFRIYLKNIHKDKHGSDTGAYDNEGRFVPQKFEDFFEKYGKKREGCLTAGEIWEGLKGQRCLMDPIGWGGTIFECKTFQSLS
ncbi:hypothetical protein FQN54_008459 [Arachnomyces sp. PD_36]|nr:hypothetical protein FQN54_008459 [Arachnomyces sp. PD_36]